MGIRLTLVALVLALLDHAAPQPPNATPNDNRVPGGTRAGDTVAISLVAQPATWRLDGDDQPGLTVVAFGEEGGPPRIPGPLVRVPVGTTMRVRVRNTLPDTLFFHGLAGAAGSDSLVLPPGSVQLVAFSMARPGTGFYWATTSATPLAIRVRRAQDATLSGAVVVDPRGAAGPPHDRILVITSHTDTLAPTGDMLRDERNGRLRLFLGINGRSWPHSERLRYALGDSVRWRVINASSAPHPMHLHGFYFRVDAHGDAARDTVYGVAERRMVVTENLRSGETMSMTWSPDRPGGWLFHCHVTHHMMPHAPVDDRTAMHAVLQHHAGSAGAMEHDMGGLVLAIDVDGARPTRALRPAVDRLRLVVRSDSSETSRWRRYGVVRDDGSASAAPTGADSVPPTGPVLVLHRGVPASIDVVNAMTVPTAVHWHGMELESYYDGVAGIGGDALRRSPMIAPGGHFEARMTPPRAGTFIYHTHADEMEQQLGGLVGALIVLEPGERLDAAHDLPLLYSDDLDGRRIRVNGRTTPAPLELRVGARYRLRLINITTERATVFLRLARDTMPTTWRIVAKDGFARPAAQAGPRPAIQPFVSGETVDVEVVPDRAGDLTLDLVDVLPPRGGVSERRVLVTVPVRVR